eukprot:4090825-Prorocentrum_lima.AAC.1
MSSSNQNTNKHGGLRDLGIPTEEQPPNKHTHTTNTASEQDKQVRRGSRVSPDYLDLSSVDFRRIP